MEVLSTVASELTKQLVQKPIASLANHASYTLRAGRHVREMETQIGMLKGKKRDAQNDIQTADRAGKAATNEVQGWLERVTALEAEAEAVTTEYGNRGCMLLGACSLDCLSNHSIGARAAKVKVDAELELQRRAGFSEITTEVPPPPVQPVPVTTLPEVSRYEIERKLGVALDFLRDGGEGSLGIWGMGGVGKTTLLLHINNALAKDPSSFGIDEAVLVTASRDCTIGKLQGLIAKELKLASQLGENLKTNIYNHLSSRNFVLLLDDLWARLDLLEVGVPPLGMVDGFKRKLILTTRSRQVCHVMEVRRTVRVECLSREAARLLFREKVGGEAINADPLIPMLADGVADECGGLPMALICIARAMAGKRRVSLWERAIRDLKASKPSEIVVQGMEEDPLPMLKVSYDYLPNARVRECLLHCALWPEDYKFPKQDLIRCWMGHGLLGEFDSVGEAYEEGDEMIDILEKASLLEYSEVEDAISNEGCVSLHDLIRDMALWIARDCGANEKKWMVLYEPPEDEKSWLGARKMSIFMDEGGFTALPSNIMCSGSNLTTLMLHDHSELSHHDLGILRHLHALAYLDLSSNPRIENFPTEICGLAKLEYLDLSGTSISRLPDEVQNLKNLKYLLLRDTLITEVRSQVLSGLERLQVLEVTSYCDPPDHIPPNTIVDGLAGLKGHLKGLGISAYSMSDLNKLDQTCHAASIRTLDIRIQSADQNPTLCLMPPGGSWSKLYDVSIEGTNIPWTEELVMEGEHLWSPKKLFVGYFEGLKDIIWKKRVEQTSVIPNIRRVHISGCPQLKHVGWIASLPLLEILCLEDCRRLKHVVVRGGGELEATATEVGGEEHKLHAFPATLKYLQLWWLPELETICNYPTNFPSLEKLDVCGCPGLKKLPSHSPASYSKLKKVECEQGWWDNLELDDDTRAALQPFVQPW